MNTHRLNSLKARYEAAMDAARRWDKQEVRATNQFDRAEAAKERLVWLQEAAVLRRQIEAQS